MPVDPLGPLVGYIMWQMLHGTGRPPEPLSRQAAIDRARADPRFADYSRADFTRAGQTANQNVRMTQYAETHSTERFVECLTATGSAPTNQIGVRVWYDYVDGHGVHRSSSVTVNVDTSWSAADVLATVRTAVQNGELATGPRYNETEQIVNGIGLAAVYCGGYSNPGLVP